MVWFLVDRVLLSTAFFTSAEISSAREEIVYVKQRNSASAVRSAVLIMNVRCLAQLGVLLAAVYSLVVTFQFYFSAGFSR